MKLSRLILGLVLSSGLAIGVSACGSSDSSDNNGNTPFGGGGGGGSGGTTSTGGGSSGSGTTYTSGSYTCMDAAPCTAKGGMVAACCTSGGQCKVVAGGKDYMCTGSSSNGGCDSAIASALSACGY